MKIGFIGLGKMGQAMVLHLLEKGVDVVVYNRSSVKTDELNSKLKIQNSKLPFKIKRSGKLTASYSIEELVKRLDPPRIIWLMVEHGKPVDEMIAKLIGISPKVSRRIHLRGVSDRTPREKLAAGDIIIDGGNSFYKDTIRRFGLLKKKGIHFLDIGTSGGLEGARQGVCMMVGGEEEVFNHVRPILDKIALPGGIAYFGPAGTGHFVKMIHNGVEYGMLQAIGEGFEILSKGMPVTKPFARPPLREHVKIDLHKVAFNWTHGSVVRGWLMQLLERSLKKDPRLESITGVVGGGSTGIWTLQTAKELKIETPVIEKSLEARKKSQTRPTFAGKIVAALRKEFGGHEVKKTHS